MGEPAWLTDLRIHALEVAEDKFHCQSQIKQKLKNGISLNLKNILSKVKTFQFFEQLPEEVKNIN